MQRGLLLNSASKTKVASAQPPKPTQEAANTVGDVQPDQPSAVGTPRHEVRCTHLDDVLNPARWANPLHIQLTHGPSPIDTERARKLVDVLHQPGLCVTALELDLSSDIDPQVLGQLLSAVDEHPELKALSLLVDGENGTWAVPEPLRCAIARSPRCLSFENIRRMLFARHFSALAQELCDPTKSRALKRVLKQFISVRPVPAKRGEPAWPYQAGELSKLAVGDEAFLIALATLSPGNQVSLKLLPDERTCQRLKTLGVSYRVELELPDDRAADAFCHWMNVHAGPTFQAVALTLRPAWSPQAWIKLINALTVCVNAGSLQAVHLDVYVGQSFHLDGPALQGGARVRSLMVAIHYPSDNPNAVPWQAVAAIEALGPRHFSLKARTLEHCKELIACVRPAVKARVEGLFVRPEWTANEGKQLVSLKDLVLDHQGAGYIVVYLPSKALMKHADGVSGLKEAVASKPAMGSLVLRHGKHANLMSDPPHWRFVNVVTQELPLRIGSFTPPVRLHGWKEGATQMLARYTVLTSEVAEYVVKVADFSDSDMLNAARVGKLAYQHGTAVALAHAMGNGSLNAQDLRALLSQANGAVDRELCKHLEEQIRLLCPRIEVWSLYEEAVSLT